ncbi:MAG: SRPBCC family protein [Planctomycetota bacterium]
MTLIITILIAIVAVLVAVVFLTPRVVEYAETIDIDGSSGQVYDAIRHQRKLMEWSAWPPETGSNCQVEGDDGQVGAQTVFLDNNGQRFGYQEVTALDEGRHVSFKLESKGPPHRPTLSFHLIPIGPEKTRVVLAFRNDITPPFHVLLRLFGIVRWTRQMHLKDLDGLKRFIERSENYRGEPLAAAA